MKRAAATLLLVLAATGTVRAAEIVSWIGTRDRVIEGQAIDIPIDLAAPLAANAPSVIQATTSGREINATALTAVLTTRGSQTYLSITPDAAQFARAGTYLVKVRIPAAGTFTATTEELTLTRPAGDLSVAVPLRAERVVYAPGFARWFPREWPLAASAADVVPSGGERVVSFLGPDQKSTGARLTLGLPDKIDAGKQSTITWKAGDAFPLGTSTGKLVIDSPQLAKPFETTVEVVSRVSRWWLLLTIALSILAGHYVRVTLERRRVRELARASVDEQLAAIAQLARTTVDPKFRQQFEDAATAMETEAENDSADLAAAIKTSQDRVKSIQDAMAAAQAKAENGIAEIRAAIGDPSAQLAPLRPLLETLFTEVHAAQLDFAAGQLALAAGALERIQPATRVEAVRLPWTEAVRQIAAMAGAWPESPANERLQGAAADAKKTAAVTSVEDVAAFVTRAAAITKALREALFAIVSGARELAARAGRELAPFRSQSGAAAALDALAATAQEPVASDVAALARQAAALRAALVGALTSVAPDKAKLPQSIGEGEFAQALAEVLLQRAQNPLGDAKAAAEPFALVSRVAEQQPPPPAAAGAIAATLMLDGVAVAGRTARVRLQFSDPSLAASSVTVTWYRDDQKLYTAPPGELTLAFEATEAPTIIRAEVSADGRAGTALRRVTPRAALPVDPERWKAIAAADEWKQTIAAGAFIVAIGYLIFGDSFLGTFPQFLAAALWGFVTDVSLPRLLTYAAPVAAKAPPLP